MQHLSRDELLRLVSAATAGNELGWLAIPVGFWHGLRVSELTGPRGFTPEVMRDGYITIVRPQGQRDRDGFTAKREKVGC